MFEPVDKRRSGRGRNDDRPCPNYTPRKVPPKSAMSPTIEQHPAHNLDRTLLYSSTMAYLALVQALVHPTTNREPAQDLHVLHTFSLALPIT